MQSTFEHFLTQQDNGVFSVTINRAASRNALNRQALSELAQIFIEAAKDPNIKIAVLTAAGDKCFAAGGDLKEFDTIRSHDETKHMSDLGRAALSAIREFPVPVVAAMNGTALGGGAELAMACDFRVANQGVKIGFIQAKLAISTSWGGGIYLIERVGQTNALRLLLTGEVLSAEQALANDLIDVLSSEDESLEDCLQDFIAPMLLPPVQSIRAVKALITESRKNQAEKLHHIESQHFVDCWLHNDHWQAVENALKK